MCWAGHGPALSEAGVCIMGGFGMKQPWLSVEEVHVFKMNDDDDVR